MRFARPNPVKPVRLRRLDPALTAFGLAALVVLGSCARGIPPPALDPAGIPDDRIGLVPLDVGAVPSPDAVVENLSEPGERSRPPRWNEAAPPFIPHGIAEFLPITRSANACLDCHAVAEKEEGEPTPIPPSHYLDLRNAPDTPRQVIAGSRAQCMSCHVSQTEAPALPAGAH